MRRYLASRRGASMPAARLVAGGALAGASASNGDLSGRARSLQQSIGADSGQIRSYEGRLIDLRARLSAVESSLAVQQALLVRIQRQLADARTRLAALKSALASDRQVLARQLVSQYESPPPDIVGVVLEAHGFTDLLERVDQLRRIARQNAHGVSRAARE